MNSRPSRRTGAPQFDLDSGWEIASTAPGSVTVPDRSALDALDWVSSPRLGTAAAMLRAADRWSFASTLRFDAFDWWYRLRFENPARAAGASSVALGFEGLATLAEVWLNGKHLLSSDNMFMAHAIPAFLLPGENELVLQFKSLDAALKARRPRPRWRAPMVEHQQLRGFRTTLLGRTPGWSPPAAAVGPWRSIWIEPAQAFLAERPQLRATVEGRRGIIRASCRLSSSDQRPASAELILTRAGQTFRAPLKTRQDPASGVMEGELAIDAVDLWWPHTHGEPALYEARIELLPDPNAVQPQTVPLSKVGFRTLQVDRVDGDFALRINGERIFCRGACWTPPDAVALETTAAASVASLDQMIAAGMNMVRVGGTMVYENDAFLDACDERGILLWQDFMFANMDYPSQDAQFRESVGAEVRQLLARLSGRPCVAVLCGNSEGEQQAAMWGAPREQWAQPLFGELLPAWCAEYAPDLIYWPSSTHGGAFPHQSDVGTSSYYGVGAYLRPLTDARRADVRFATECLAFANVPEESLLDELSRLGSAKVHSPLWKSRVPRDLGAGWDFDDVRDHYLREIFDVDPLSVRYAEHDRYLDLSRAVTIEAMTAAYREWRRQGSTCNGALLWFLRDLWPGAGWGIIDSNGEPKSGYYGLARLLQPRTVFLLDEGGNGLDAHLVNEGGADFAGALEIALITAAGRTTHHRRTVTVPARRTLKIPVASLLEGFSDLSYSYRFGAAPYEAVRAALQAADGTEIAHDFHFLQGHRRMALADLGMTARAQRLPDQALAVEVSSTRLARFVTLHVAGFRAADQYFHLAPGVARRILLQPIGAVAECDLEPVGEMRALNSIGVTRISAG